MKDYYYALGVSEGCILEEIKDAYRKLSKKFHPDLNPGEDYFAHRYLDIQEAYDTLSDPDRRTSYDIEFKKFKSGYIRSYHSPRYGPADQRFQNKPYRLKSRGPGSGVVITLILLAIIFCVYGIKYFNHPKTTMAINPVATVESPPVAHPYKKHKKHNTVNRIASFSAKHKFDTAKTVPVKQLTVVKTPVVVAPFNRPAIIKPAIIKPAIIKPLVVKPLKPIQDTIKAAHPDKPFLYATYIHPNQTGVVNLRQADNFNSAVIQVIPANVRVLVLQRGDTYYKVNFHNNIGYVPKWSLQSE